MNIIKKIAIFGTTLFSFFCIITSKENFILYASEVKDFSITNFRNDVAKNLYSLCDIIAFDHIEKITDKYEIYGNTNLTEKEFNQKVENGNDKIYFIYSIRDDNQLPYDASLSIKTNGEIYSYQYKEYETSNKVSKMNGIISFIYKYVKLMNNNEYYLLATDENICCTSNNTPTTFVNCVAEREYINKFSDKGYIVYHISVSKYIVNSDSIIFIVSLNNQFVPGIVAKKNNESGYDSYKNQEGFVHMTVEQAYDANEEYMYGKRCGNIPYKKDFWPINEPGVVAITSSINTGLTMGYSFENGFSLEDASVKDNRNIGAEISYGYSKTITKTEPALSAQVNSSNPSICEWYYTYSKDAEETYHLNTNYMFEISNSPRDMLIGDFRLKLDYKFIIDKGFWNKQQEVECSSDLIVRPGQKQAIYSFCNGMI